MHIGIVGGGQLGRMLALAGYPLGFRFTCLEPGVNSPLGQISNQIVAAYDDESALARLQSDTDLVTYEFENVPMRSAHFLETNGPLYPPARALETGQDRVTEKTFFRSLGIPTPEFVAVRSLAELPAAVDQIGLPAVLKTRRMGYDGKGQWLLRRRDDCALLGVGSEALAHGLILEACVPFQRELSVIAVRGRDGQFACYPLAHNVHRAGILRVSRAPFITVQAAAAFAYAKLVMEALHYVGVLAIELFDTGDQLLVNEMAPRVHNSGHWTMDGAVTNQFENHLRAIAGMPVGATDARGHCAMVNLVGDAPALPELLAIPGAHVHLYGKSARPGRKLGHVNLVEDSAAQLEDKLAQVRVLARSDG
jgi:5-(carboxyamino)imidazole ribonucleotide synthase